ncbi:MAG: SIS domain-containing protein [Oscillospiraceae bacterium]|nr:SIS domain-containing protein [Oscillospiraceae bacterium]
MSDHTMYEYVHETRAAALGIVDKSQELCAGFARQYASKKYTRIWLVASGTSNNACVTAKYFMEKTLGIPCVLATSYNFAHYESVFYPDTDLMVAVTQEGESTNTIDAIQRANDMGMDNFVVTEYLDNTCTQIAKGKVTIDCDREFMGPKTKGYTCTVLTLYIMALEAAKAAGKLDEAQYAAVKARMRKTVDNLDNVITAAEKWFEINKADLLPCEKCYVIGYGANVGTAIEGALKSLETVRYTFFSFEMEEFLHGPLASVKTDVYTILVCPPSYGYERANGLFKIMHEQHPHVYSIGAQEGFDSPHILAAPFVNDEDFSTLEYCVPLQLFAYLLYTAKGIDLNVREYPRTNGALPTKAKPLQR